jgi:hypothetical protein
MVRRKGLQVDAMPGLPCEAARIVPLGMVPPTQICQHFWEIAVRSLGPGVVGMDRCSAASRHTATQEPHTLHMERRRYRFGFEPRGDILAHIRASRIFAWRFLAAAL